MCADVNNDGTGVAVMVAQQPATLAYERMPASFLHRGVCLWRHPLAASSAVVCPATFASRLHATCKPPPPARMLMPSRPLTQFPIPTPDPTQALSRVCALPLRNGDLLHGF